MQVTDKGRKESNERKEREGVCTRVRVEGCVLPQLSVFGVLACSLMLGGHWSPNSICEGENLGDSLTI